MNLYQIRYKDRTSGDRILYSSYKKAEKEIMNRGYTNEIVSIREGMNYTPFNKRYFTDTWDDYMYIEEISLNNLRILGSISNKSNEEDNTRYFSQDKLR